jgi:hypothetical protein
VILKRNYVVLAKGDDGRWQQFTAIYARSKSEALDEATATGSYTTGTFRVVTARAWGREMSR